MDERADLRRRLEAGQSIQLFAPRRVGKTWLLRALEKDL
jgi:predicted AAA+ superfamily ATPase